MKRQFYRLGGATRSIKIDFQRLEVIDNGNI